MKINLRFNYHSLVFKLLLFCCSLACWGAIVYFIYALNWPGLIISLILAIISLFIILRIKAADNSIKTAPAGRPAGTADQFKPKTAKKRQIFYYLLLTLYCLAYAAAMALLLTSRTDAAIISPWQVLPAYYFLIYGLAGACLLLLILKHAADRHSSGLLLILISSYYFLAFAVALIIYRLGYGFDPFVHQATEELISQTGSVAPKPYYYLGQYALIVILHKITALPLIWLDKLLLPLTAALSLPLTLYRALKNWFADKTTSLLLILILLIMPFSFLIVTSPQNFAYLMLLLIILLGLNCRTAYDLVVIYLLALTALAFQPIAGLPALLLALALTIFYSDRKKLKKYLYGLVFTLAAAILPLSFVVVNKLNSPQAGQTPVSGPQLNQPLDLLTVPGRENYLLNFIYLYGFNLKFILLLLTAVGLFIAYRFRARCKIFFLYLLLSAGLGLSYLLTKLLPFTFLIDYERSDFPNRVLLIAALTLSPFIILSLFAFTSKILSQTRLIKYPLLLFLLSLLPVSLYLSYPRFDNYFNSRGYSVSDSDIKMVRWINDNTDQDYIVLANQQVSAAALREFGFKRYFQSTIGNQQSAIFYYPIPTGGPLYQYYLEMVYDRPGRQTALKAMELAGVKRAYFVLNNYWWAFPKILEEAKLEANSWQEISNGEVYVFLYKK